MKPSTNLNIEGLVHRDKVHRSIYTDPDIFELEMEKIFGRAWVFVGHESQVPKPGDHVTALVGHQPVVLSRHTDGKVYVIYNSCGHRGAIVCNEDKGNSRLFRCCYHGWTFKTNGDLNAVTMPYGYDGVLDLSDPELGMGRLPRVESYRGFVFASLAADGPDLTTHLGSARESIDEVVDRAPDGEVDMSAGVHKYVFRGNWKFQLENSVDMYHVPFSHESTLSRGGRQFSRRTGDEGGSEISVRGEAAKRWEQRVAWGARNNGHSFAGNQPIAESERKDPVFLKYRELLVSRLGAEAAARVMQPKRHNTAFFPNMTMQALNQHVRVIRPLSVDRTEVYVYPLLLKGAPAEMNQDIIQHLNLTHSAASLIQTDDLECFRRCQEGLAAENTEWVLFSRGLASDAEDHCGDYLNKGTVELPQRAQYAAWARYMSNAA